MVSRGSKGRRTVRQRHLALIVAMAITVGVLFAGIGAGLADDVACDQHGCISLSKLSSNIRAKLHNNVVGFVSIVGGQQTVFEGQARTSADSPATAMLPDLPINIASVSKVLTTIVVLQSLGRHNLTLDTKISPYLYKDWKRGPLIDTITFRMLLSHAAGFRADCGGINTTYFVLKALIGAGVKKSDMVDQNGNPVHSYNNCNFAIFREMLPQMEGNDLNRIPEFRRPFSSAPYYITYMNKHVFAPVGVPARACKAPKTSNDMPEYRFPAIMSYPNPPNANHGEDWGDWTLACGGGGWVLSAGDLFLVIKDLANGQALLTKAERALMMASAPNCIGWDCSVRNDCPDPNLCKNGGLEDERRDASGHIIAKIKLWTYVGVLKCNVPVVVIVNSVLPAPYETSSDIIGLVKDAQDNAKVILRTPGPCS